MNMIINPSVVWDLFPVRDHSHAPAHHSRDEGPRGPDGVSPAVCQPGDLQSETVVHHLTNGGGSYNRHFSLFCDNRLRKTSCCDRSWRRFKSTTRTGSSCGSRSTGHLKVSSPSRAKLRVKWLLVRQPRWFKGCSVGPGKTQEMLGADPSNHISSLLWMWWRFVLWVQLPVQSITSFHVTGCLLLT